MTNNFYGAVYVLTDPSRAEEIADQVSAKYFNDSPYQFTVTESTPTSLPVDLKDQMDAHQSALDEDSFILTVYPTEGAEVNHN